MTRVLGRFLIRYPDKDKSGDSSRVMVNTAFSFLIVMVYGFVAVL